MLIKPSLFHFVIVLFLRHIYHAIFSLKVYTDIAAYQNVRNPIATIGTFDGVHIGHQHIIARLREIADEEDGEVVLLTFFPHPRMVLQPDAELQLINAQQEKIELLRKYGVDHLVVLPFTKAFSRLTAVEYVRDVLVNALHVKRLVIGYDHQFGRNREGSFENLKELASLYDFDVEEISAQVIADVNVSSTKIRKAILTGDLTTAHEYLGHAFTLSGRVVEGNKLGRTMGFPTANLEIAEHYKIIPGDGVYAVRVNYKDTPYQGMLNIGKKPTVAGGARSMEVHLLDFDEQIYGEVLQLELVERIRDEQKFASLDELKVQLQKDEITTRQILG